ncbi:MAG TPA: biotin synthase BioB [bacterium]|nr:biotin synthase BioB [bacterium]
MNNTAREFIQAMEDKSIGAGDVSFEEGCRLIRLEGPDIVDLIASANRVRHQFKGDKINTCAIVNAKSGNCSENCAFCAQSVHFKTGIETYGFMDREAILQAAEKAGGDGAEALGIVTAWKGLKEGPSLDEVLDRIRALAEMGTPRADASLGDIPTIEIAHKLKDAGLQCYNHNLETARSYFPKICTTHTYEDRVRTVRFCKEVGIQVCCGGIFGMGEIPEQRVELAVALRELEVDVLPMNFLHPVPGTPLGHVTPMRPMEILKTIAVYRLMLPHSDIMTAGGRELNLRDLQSWMFMAGASHTMLGNYLTTMGRDAQSDLQMIKDLDLTY